MHRRRRRGCSIAPATGRLSKGDKDPRGLRPAGLPAPVLHQSCVCSLAPLMNPPSNMPVISLVFKGNPSPVAQLRRRISPTSHCCALRAVAFLRPCPLAAPISSGARFVLGSGLGRRLVGLTPDISTWSSSCKRGAKTGTTSAPAEATSTLVAPTRLRALFPSVCRRETAVEPATSRLPPFARRLHPDSGFPPPP